jgi:hypothetical protein
MARIKALSLDEQLVAFLDQWEATRTAQAHKYRLRANREISEQRPGWQNCYLSDLRSLTHYEHELKMLQELRRRAFTRILRTRTFETQVTT